MRNVEFIFSLLMKREDCLAFVGDLEEHYGTIRQTKNRFRATLWVWSQVVISIGPLALAALRRRWLKLFSTKAFTLSGANAFLDPSERINGLSTGFTKFDEMTGGLHGGELVILAARSSMGKTALALNIAHHVAAHPLMRKPVVVFSLEMSSANLLTRLLCAEARVDQHKFRVGYLNGEERRRLQVALADLTESPLYLDDKAVDLMDIHSKLRRMKAERGLSLVVIDYLQLISSRGRSENRNQEVSAISRRLKLMAKDLDVPFLVLSQLSRASETSIGDHRPRLSDLQDSGSIEQDADLVAFIFREEVYKRDREDLQGLADLIIAKQRNGPIGTVALRFQGQFTRFENRAEDLGEVE